MSILLEEQLVLEELSVQGYERVIKVTDERVHLQAIICIHNTSLGPALGGVRIYPYLSFNEALIDVMRLAKGMTYKSALAESGLGGGKAVIFGDPKTTKTEEKLLSFGKAVDRLQGAYIAAEDSGCTTADAMVIRNATPYVVGLSHDKGSGDPGPFTAWGTLRGIQAVLQKLDGSDDLEGRTIAVQGLGSVGESLVAHLFWAGAKLVISDIDSEKVERLGKRFGAKVVAPGDIYSVGCDVFAPCAMGGILNSQTIPLLGCRAVAGAANNQLLKESDGEELLKRKILYAPDFVINSGGLINVTQELLPDGYHPQGPREKIHHLYDKLLSIFEIADQHGSSTHAAAIALGNYCLRYGIGKRTTEPCFHHTV